MCPSTSFAALSPSRSVNQREGCSSAQKRRNLASNMVRLRSPVSASKHVCCWMVPSRFSMCSRSVCQSVREAPHGSRLIPRRSHFSIVTAPISAMTTTGSNHRPPTERGCHVADGAWIDPSGACQGQNFRHACSFVCRALLWKVGSVSVGPSGNRRSFLLRRLLPITLAEQSGNITSSFYVPREIAAPIDEPLSQVLPAFNDVALRRIGGETAPVSPNQQNLIG